MKVVQVVPHYFPYVGGINTHIKLLSEALVREGTEVQVYTTDPSRSLKKSEVINGVEVRRFDSFAPNDAYCFSLALFNALRKTKADIIHAHGIHDLPLLLSASAKSHSKVPLASTFYYHGKGHTFFRNVLFQFYKQTLAEYVLRKTDLLISLSEYEKELVKSDFRTNVRVTVIPACLRIDWSDIASAKPSSGSIKKLVFVGRLEKYKGVQYLLHALKILSKQMTVELWVIGDGPYKQELQKLAKKLEITNEVVFSSKKGNAVIDEYLSCDLVVVPSLHESFNLVAIEALACGAPVLTTPRGEACTLIKDGWCTSLEDPACIDEVYHKLEALLSNNYDEDRFREISRNVLERYSPQRIARQTLSAYTSVINCT